MSLKARNESLCHICGKSVSVNDFVKPCLVHNVDKCKPTTRWVHVDCILENDERIPLCKHFVRLGLCMYMDSCNFRHPSESKQVRCGAARHRNGTWSRRRVYNDGKVGIFRRWLLTVFGCEYLSSGSGVLDIAGGKGETSFELLNMNGIPCTVVDPRPLDLRRYHKKYARGFYHKNEVLRVFNTLPLQTHTQEGTAAVEVRVRQPRHIRCYFHMPLLVDTCKPCFEDQWSQSQEINPDMHSHDGTDHSRVNLPQCLQTPDLFLSSLQYARDSSWTTKGLIQSGESDPVSGSTRELDATVEDTPAAQFVYDDRRVILVNHDSYRVESYEQALALVRECSIIIGMHPDQATEHIIDFAIANNKPFAVIPCCVYSKQFPRRRMHNNKLVTTYADLVGYLMAKAPRHIRAVELGFEGKCVLLYYIPPDSPTPGVAYDPAVPIQYVTVGVATQERINCISSGLLEDEELSGERMTSERE